MVKKNKDNSFLYQIIGAVTLLLVLVIVLPIFLYNSEEEKNKEFERIQQNDSMRSDDEWRSSIQPMDDDNGESVNYQVDELSIDGQTLPNNNTEAVNKPVIEDIDADIAVMNDLIPIDEEQNEAPIEDITDSVEAVATTNAESEEKKESKVETPQPKEKDDLERIIEQHTGTQSKQKAYAADKVSVGWVVQVGTYSEPDNAQRMIDNLSTKGFDPQFALINSNGAKVTRVWVGPYEKRVFASEVMKKVESIVGFKPFIRSFPYQ